MKNQTILFFFLVVFSFSCESKYKSKCERGKEAAKNDFTNGVYKQPYSKGLFLKDSDFQIYLIRFAKEKYGIEVYESTSEYDERKECYEQEMSSLLNFNFGFSDITDVAWESYVCEYFQKFNYSDLYCKNVDTLASFVNGVNGLFDYLNKNLTYPEKSLEKNIEGRVFVSFIVEANGNINNVEILRGISNDIDSTVIDVIEKMPEWIPAKYNGKEVNSKYILPIKFAIDKNEE